MSVKTTIIAQIEQIATEQNKKLAPLKDDLLLAESGLDSLAVAVLVARLEDLFGFDPFSTSDDNAHYPMTFGDFVNFYKSSKRR
jgi:acyl carrier protein